MLNELVYKFKLYLKEDGKSEKTMGSYVGDTSVFVAFLESKGIDFSIQNEEKVSKRNRMINLLLLYTGLRVSELCEIKITNIDFLMSQLKIFGKGSKVREVLLKTEVAEVIKEYLVECSKNPFRERKRLEIQHS